ncbi:pseudouridine-5'-phosphate glycosidase [Phaeobacter sp. S60]|jgi:pseudouridine-5'-phosphate glycosidase|uniref:pseudouridine-5'-phosphate glycosidase n=1 Tax=Phaeobacter sp. S60 TaxID=1569353 RepID=UPI00058AF188|nr:pseudouridine-5'-phosphate glycosidase [Phaeobacter sp. S60]KII12809.1 pseudouridine-5'-phosphate glycosidase [Phaeobacter sp. S60]MCB1527096.1 pseudouridine-5'-phosphate glycosidase [Hyphomicrobiaceae bacterium]
MNALPHFVDVHADVLDALNNQKPVVALESTIITHGMPFPENMDMAISVEEEIRHRGAVPATIAVLDGRLKIGLDAEELSRLAKVSDALKISRADIAFAISQKKSAGTTVAATMIVARMAGIRVFATGGIGGVHAGAETSFDISADLTELGKTDVMVVAAGAKAILDVPKTLEVLETQGVAVVGYRTDTLPAFWTAESDLEIPLRLDSANEIAEFQKVRDDLRLEAGLLVANPIPADDEIPSNIIDGYIETAQSEMAAQGISGKAVTPFLLQRIFELSEGRSLKANIALVKNNARLAADIAVAFHAPSRP